MISVIGHRPAEHRAIRPLDRAGDHEGHRRLAEAEAAAAVLERPASVQWFGVTDGRAHLHEMVDHIRTGRQIGRHAHDVVGETVIEPHLRCDERDIGRTARRGHVHRRPMESELLHQHRDRRRRQQPEVATAAAAPVVGGMEILPVPHITQHDRVHHTDRATGTPAAGLRIGDRLPGRLLERPGETARAEGFVAALGHQRHPCAFVAAGTVSGVPPRRRLTAGQAAPEGLAAPAVAAHHTDACDRHAILIVLSGTRGRVRHSRSYTRPGCCVRHPTGPKNRSTRLRDPLAYRPPATHGPEPVMITHRPETEPEL